MRPLFAFLFCVSSIQLFGQDSSSEDSLQVFEGYLIYEDSIPVENAYLISYKTRRIVATDSTGYFRARVLPGDSLMINHLTLEPQVIHPDQFPTPKARIVVDFRTYMITPVISNSYKKQMANFNKNVEKLYSDLRKNGYAPQESQYRRTNAFNPDELNPGLTIQPGALLNLFKRKKNH